MWLILQQQEGVSDHDGTLPITSLGTKDWFSEQNPKLASPRQRADHSYTLYFSSISFSWQEAKWSFQDSCGLHGYSSSWWQMNTTLCPGSWRQWFITNLVCFFLSGEIASDWGCQQFLSHPLKSLGLAHHILALNCCLARIRHSITYRPPI